jgi:hypothetical protein
MARQRAAQVEPSPQPLPLIPEDSDKGEVDEEVNECLDNISGALKSTDIAVLRKVRCIYLLPPRPQLIDGQFLH